MKNFTTKNFLRNNAPLLLILLFAPFLVYGFATGIGGLTQKTTTNGCSCHSSTPTSTVIAFISGPDSVTEGETVNYTIEISEPGKTGAGVNISTRSGALGIVSSNLHLLNGELLQNSNIAMTNHAVIITFSYTAPNSLTTDTIWATGLATNSNNQSNGDIWNWAPAKRIIVKNPVGIIPVSGQTASNYSLSQNYPNPFNPTTNIKFTVPKSSLVKLVVYDIAFREVETLVNGKFNAGTFNVTWDASKYSSGVYFYKLVTDGFTEAKKLILIK